MYTRVETCLELGIEPRASCVLNKGSTTEPYPSSKGDYYNCLEGSAGGRLQGLTLLLSCTQPWALYMSPPESSTFEPQPHPPLKLFFNVPNPLSRFLHDKNSREFLYYRKKVAEIRKEAQKPQAAAQKGKWLEKEEKEHCGMWQSKPVPSWAVGVALGMCQHTSGPQTQLNSEYQDWLRCRTVICQMPNGGWGSVQMLIRT